MKTKCSPYCDGPRCTLPGCIGISVEKAKTLSFPDGGGKYLIGSEYMTVHCSEYHIHRFDCLVPLPPSPIDKEAEEHHSSIINELLSEITPEQQKDVDIKMLQEAKIGLEEELRQAREEIKTLKK